jgi:uracil-DNA glycosylase
VSGVKFSDLRNLIDECELCDLHYGRKNPVVGVGPVPCNIMFIGEAPGFYENESGIPFVGRAGELFNELLTSIGLLRRSVYITNAAKCRPPKNRAPKLQELEICNIYLKAEIEAVQPKVIIPLGQIATSLFMRGAKMGEVHGKGFRSLVSDYVMIPQYHPAAGLRFENIKRQLFEDFKNLPYQIKNRTGIAMTYEKPVDKIDPKQLGFLE